MVPRLLQPTVVRGAANVASVRRLRNLVHGVVALNRVVAPEDGGGAPGLGGALAAGGAPGSPGGSVHWRGDGSPADRCGSQRCNISGACTAAEMSVRAGVCPEHKL